MNYYLDPENLTDESDLGNEPVTLQEVKDYLRLEGYIDDDESTSDSLSDFDFDDSLIEDIIIPGARQSMEKGTGLSLIPKTLRVTMYNSSGNMEIPFGPVRSIVSLYDSNSTEILDTVYTTNGGAFLRLGYPKYKGMVLTYEAGYITLPKALKLDLLRVIAYMYENRGDDPSIEKYISQISSKYIRDGWL
jgi:uncharacterized phiE125 gp8 family phage protein